MRFARQFGVIATSCETWCRGASSRRSRPGCRAGDDSYLWNVGTLSRTSIPRSKIHFHCHTFVSRPVGKNRCVCIRRVPKRVEFALYRVRSKSSKKNGFRVQGSGGRGSRRAAAAVGGGSCCKFRLMCGKMEVFRTGDTKQSLDLQAIGVDGGGKMEVRFAATQSFCSHVLRFGNLLLSHAKAPRRKSPRRKVGAGEGLIPELAVVN